MGQHRTSSRWFLLAVATIGLGGSRAAYAQVPYIEGFTDLGGLLGLGSPESQALLLEQLGYLQNLPVADTVAEVAAALGQEATLDTYDYCDRYGRWEGESAAIEGDQFDAESLPAELHDLASQLLGTDYALAFSAEGSNDTLVGPCDGLRPWDREGGRLGLALQADVSSDLQGLGTADLGLGIDLGLSSVIARGKHADVATLDFDLGLGLDAAIDGNSEELGIVRADIFIGVGVGVDVTDTLTHNDDGSTRDQFAGSTALGVAVAMDLDTQGMTAVADVDVHFDMPFETTTDASEHAYATQSWLGIDGGISVLADATLSDGTTEASTFADLALDIDGSVTQQEACTSADGSDWSCTSSGRAVTEVSGPARARGATTLPGMSDSGFDMDLDMDIWSNSEFGTNDAGTSTSTTVSESRLVGTATVPAGLIPTITGEASGPASTRQTSASLTVGGAEVQVDTNTSDLAFAGEGGGGDEHTESRNYSASVWGADGGSEYFYADTYSLESSHRVEQGNQTTIYTVVETSVYYSYTCYDRGADCGIVDPSWDSNPWSDYKSKWGQYSHSEYRTVVETRDPETGESTVELQSLEISTWGDPVVATWLEVADVDASCEALGRLGDADVNPAAHVLALPDCGFDFMTPPGNGDQGQN